MTATHPTVYEGKTSLCGEDPHVWGKSHLEYVVRAFRNGALGGSRTPDRLVRSQELYPAELPAQ